MKKRQVLHALIASGGMFWAGLSGATTIMNTDWVQKHAPVAELQAHDFTLLGDSINLSSGGIQFEQVDVSLPGNSSLPVEIRRRLNPSRMLAGDFGDWKLAIPTISTKILMDEWSANNRWGKVRCSGALKSAIPNASWPTHWTGGAPITPEYYSDGVILDVPGRTTSPLLDKTVTAGWPAGASKVTADNWYLTCLSNIDGAGTEGFVAVAPNGDRYTFNVVMNTGAREAEFDIWEYISMDSSGTPFFAWTKMGVHYDVLAVSQVTDVHGNSVQYHYNSSNQLIGISSNDGREIAITRSPSGGASIVSVTANPNTAPRTWSYTLASKLVSSYGPPAIGNGPGTIRQDYRISLTTVTLPDGRQWQYDLANLTAPGVPGTQYGTTTCKQFNRSVSVTHPDGVRGVFQLQEVTLRLGQGSSQSSGAFCPNTNLGNSGTTQLSDVMAVTSKTLSGPGMPTSVWTYSYASGSTEIVTTVVQPDNTKKVVRHPVPYSFTAPNPNAKLSKEELFATPTAPVPVQVTNYTYLVESPAGGNFLYFPPNETFSPIHSVETTITRGSDWYKTRNTYDSTRTSATYSYGFPTQVDAWSSLGGGTRTTTISYANDMDDWVLGLKNTVTKNTKPFDHFEYDTKGRITSQDRFGIRVGNYSYFLTGTQAGLINTYTQIVDTNNSALNRVTTFSGWKRGTPTTVTRPDNTTLVRAVDDNGWVTSITDWNGTTTTYEYNPVGWLTLINRAMPWSDTTIGYSYSTGSLVQTATRGTEQDTTTYDAMLRPVQKVRMALSDGGGSIYSSISFDAMGRTSFASLPSDAAGSPFGTSTSYDALGRVKSTTNTATTAVTNYTYLSGNKVKVTDPLLNDTTRGYSGYGSPDDGNEITVDKPEGISVINTYDIYGNLTGIAQSKGGGAYLNSAFYYNSQQLLCRKSVPETGDTLYLYNAAGEMKWYIEGQPSGSDCPTAQTPAWVSLWYDDDGRLTTTNYPNCTPDITRTYDNNNNLLTLWREGANWTYTYNTADLLTSETLTINGRTYAISNNYDVNEKLTQKTYPSGNAYTYTNNGLNQVVAIQGDVQYYVSNTSWWPNGKIHFLTQGNGNLFDQRLDNAQRVNYIGSTYGDKLSYPLFDLNNRIKQITATSNSAYNRVFTYDDAGRLETASGPWGTGTMIYDPLSNIKSKTLGSRAVNINYDAANRVSQVQDTATGTRAYGYDSRGNTTSDGLHTFTYDDSNQPIAMTGTGGGRYRYDGNLKRVKEVVGGVSVYSIYDRSGALIMRHNTTAGTKTDYLTVAGQTFARVTNGVATYPINDHLGTALWVAAQNGSIPASQTYNYGPFGEVLTGSGSGRLGEQGYTGHVEDVSGLTYMQARYYDPVIGRFLSADPIGYADQLSLYAYVRDDPLNKTDPTGLGFWQDLGRFFILSLHLANHKKPPDPPPSPQKTERTAPAPSGAGPKPKPDPVPDPDPETDPKKDQKPKNDTTSSDDGSKMSTGQKVGIGVGAVVVVGGVACAVLEPCGAIAVAAAASAATAIQATATTAAAAAGVGTAVAVATQ